MKRMYYFLAAAAILAVVGCAKEAEKEIVNPEGNKVTLRACVEDSETRVSIGNDYAFAFQSGDKVSVLTTDGAPVEFETSDSGTTAVFEGTFGEGKTIGSFALYPASENHEADGKEVLFFMNEELIWKADESYMPMLGKVVDGNITFKAVGGVMKLIVYNIPSTAAHLQFTATNKKISGEFEIADASVVNPVIVTASKNASDDTIFIDFSEDYSTNKVFYIPLPTGTIDGFTISFLDESSNDIEGASRTTTASLNVTRNKIILAPALNMAPAEEVVLWSENFSGYSAGSVPEEGTGYGNVVVSYSVEDGFGDTKIYREALAGGTSPELLVGKNGGSFTASNIPSSGASSAVLTFKSNKNSHSVSTSTEGVLITKVNGSSYSYNITIPSSVAFFDLSIESTGNDNVRIDDIVLTAAVGTVPTTPSISTQKDNAPISAGNHSASIDGVRIINPLDNQGIVASTNVDWLDLVFEGNQSFEVGKKLKATAKSLWFGDEARVATVTLKATGATKTVTFTQNPSVVKNPTLSATTGDATFTISWANVTGAASYVGYYSATELTDPTTGTQLNIASGDDGYTAVPSQPVANGTTFYIYVKVATLDNEHSNFAIAEGWASTEVTPQAPSSDITATINVTNVNNAHALGDGRYADYKDNELEITVDGVQMKAKNICKNSKNSPTGATIGGDFIQFKANTGYIKNSSAIDISEIVIKSATAPVIKLGATSSSLSSVTVTSGNTETVHGVSVTTYTVTVPSGSQYFSLEPTSTFYLREMVVTYSDN